MVLGLGLRLLREALDRKAEELQREFIRLSEELEVINQQMLEVEPEQREPLKARRADLRARQAALAEEINLWRERARQVTMQPGNQALDAFLEELSALGEPQVDEAIARVRQMMEASPEELEQMAEARRVEEAQTPAGRLLQRARTEYDLRLPEPSARQRAAVEFASRPGVAQDDEMVAEIEAALEDPDPFVREVAVLTTVQLHRFRAMHLADLEAAHRSVKRLTEIEHPSAIPALIQVVETRRTGYAERGGEMVEVNNDRSRMMALLRLVEWHTPEAKVAVQQRRFDQDPTIAKAAERALELFPGPWNGPLSRKPD